MIFAASEVGSHAVALGTRRASDTTFASLLAKRLVNRLAGVVSLRESAVAGNERTPSPAHNKSPCRHGEAPNLPPIRETIRTLFSLDLCGARLMVHIDDTLNRVFVAPDTDGQRQGKEHVAPILILGPEGFRMTWIRPFHRSIARTVAVHQTFIERPPGLDGPVQHVPHQLALREVAPQQIGQGTTQVEHMFVSVSLLSRLLDVFARVPLRQRLAQLRQSHRLRLREADCICILVHPRIGEPPSNEICQFHVEVLRTFKE